MPIEEETEITHRVPRRRPRGAETAGVGAELPKIIVGAAISLVVSLAMSWTMFYGSVQAMQARQRDMGEAIKHLVPREEHDSVAAEQARYQATLNARMDRIENKLDAQGQQVNGLYRLLVDHK